VCSFTSLRGTSNSTCDLCGKLFLISLVQVPRAHGRLEEKAGDHI